MAISAAFLPAVATAQVVRGTANTSVTANVGADASIAVSSPTTLTPSGGAFSAFTGSTVVTFYVRTTRTGGSGSIVLQAAEFSPAGGPTVSGGSLTYTCTGAPAVGSACAGTQTASTSATTPIVSGIGANARAQAAGTTVNWSVTNSPFYSTGTYASSVTFTLAAN